MEELQGPINPFLVGEDLDAGWLEEFVTNYGSNYGYEDPNNEEDVSPQSSEGKMSVLQMLQTAETLVPTSVTPVITFPLIHEPNYFQLLLRLQNEKMMVMSENRDFSCNLASPSELDSCVTNINNRNYPVKEEPVHAQLSPRKKCTDEHQKAKSGSQRVNVVPKEKRKRNKPSKSTEEEATQRMLHIAVERNRRKLMNEHLNTLRSLMPSSYARRGDQASIIGGAIDYVKEMEQLLQSLEAEKAVKQHQSADHNNMIPTVSSSSSTSTYQYRNNLDYIEGSNNNNNNNNTNNNGYSTQIRRSNNGDCAENRSDFAEIKVVVIQNHVNLKIQCQRRFGHLLQAILTFQELRLTILHLNVTSLHTLAHYSFNLKIEDDCGLRTADDVVRAVHHIFN